MFLSFSVHFKASTELLSTELRNFKSYFDRVPFGCEFMIHAVLKLTGLFGFCFRRWSVWLRMALWWSASVSEARSVFGTPRLLSC